MNDLSDDPRPLNTEEGIIYELVDDIIGSENKISDIKKTLIKPDVPDNEDILQDISLKSKLSQTISEIESTRIKIVNMTNQHEQTKNIIQKEITKLEKNITELEQSLKELENNYMTNLNKSSNLHPTSSANKNIYKISYEKIEEIINKKKNDDDLNNIFLEYNQIDSQKIKLENKIKEKNSVISQLNNRLQMMKEEKLFIKDNIANLISTKESIEELNKIYINSSISKIIRQMKHNPNNLNINTNNINNNLIISPKSIINDPSYSYRNTSTNFNYGSGGNMDLELYHFEICQADVTKISKDIADNLVLYIKNLNKNKYEQNLNLEDNQNLYLNNNELIEDEQENNIDISINFNKDSNQNFRIIMRNQINNIIQNDVVSFINIKSNPLTIISANDVNLFLSNLTDKIIIHITNNNSNNFTNKYIENAETRLKLKSYIKNCIKINYIEKIITLELQFIDKEYKNIKKEIKKELDEINQNLTKLESQHDECLLHQKKLKEKEKLLVSKKTKNSIYLSPEEKKYIELNEEINKLLNKKNDKLNELEIEENNYNAFYIENNNYLNQLNIDQINLENKLKLLNEEISGKNNKANDTINVLRKEINDKFKVIKLTLNLYKKKHGKNNMNLYNILVSKINQTLKNNTKTFNNANLLLLNSNTKRFNNKSVSMMQNEKNNIDIIENNEHFKNINNSYNNNCRSRNYNSNSNYNYSAKSASKFTSMPCINNMNDISRRNKILSNNLYYDCADIIDAGNDQNNNEYENINYGNDLYNDYDDVYNNYGSLKNNMYDNGQDNEYYKDSANECEKEQKKLSLTIRNLKNKNFKKPNSVLLLSNNNNNLVYLNNNNAAVPKLNSNLTNNTNSTNNNVIGGTFKADEVKSIIEPLFSQTFCFFRNNSNTNNDNKFNPLYHSNVIDKFNFKRAILYVDKGINNLYIKLMNSNSKVIPLKDIESTIVNNNIKFIIKIYQKYKHYKFKYSLEDFVKLNEFSDIPLSYSDKVKATENKYFNFFISFFSKNNNYGSNGNTPCNKSRIELILFSYEDMKKWLNGLGFLIKNKNNLNYFYDLIENSINK